MSLKESNEITVKIKCELNEFYKIVKEKVLIKNDSSYYDYDIVIGSYYDRYDGMGKFFNFISSDFLFIFLMIFDKKYYLDLLILN